MGAKGVTDASTRKANAVNPRKLRLLAAGAVGVGTIFLVAAAAFWFRCRGTASQDESVTREEDGLVVNASSCGQQCPVSVTIGVCCLLSMAIGICCSSMCCLSYVRWQNAKEPENWLLDDKDAVVAQQRRYQQQLRHHPPPRQPSRHVQLVHELSCIVEESEMDACTSVLCDQHFKSGKLGHSQALQHPDTTTDGDP